jgi:hypothetical protein
MTEYTKSAAEAVNKLVDDREITRSKKKNVFATFLDCAKHKFYAKNPDKYFSPSLIRKMETRWQVSRESWELLIL